MAFEAFANFGNGAKGVTGSLIDIFGSSQSQSGTQSGTSSGTTTEQLAIDPAGVNKIIQDILSSKDGLASIFSEEQLTGLYNSTGAKSATGNLLANLAGEIAKLTAKKTTSNNSTQKTTTDANTSSGGLLGQILGK